MDPDSCKICGWSFEIEHSENPGHKRGICDKCLKVGLDRITQEDASAVPPEMEVDKKQSKVKTDLSAVSRIQCKCSLSLGLGFFRILNGRGVVNFADCGDVFLVENVLDNLRTVASSRVDIPKDKFVAVYAFILGDEVSSSDLNNKVVMVIRKEEFFCHADRQ